VKDYVSEMKEYVSEASNWIDVVLLFALMSVVVGIFLPVFPWSSLVFASILGATVHRMQQPTPHRSTTQVLWDVQAESVAGVRSPRPSPVIERF
jgi:hypothetical protein